MAMIRRKTYDRAFKDNAVNLSHFRSDLSALARELGISSDSLYRWRKESQQNGSESFFKSLKTEVIYGNKLLDKKQMKILLFEYIEIWYNKKKRPFYLIIKQLKNLIENRIPP